MLKLYLLLQRLWILPYWFSLLVSATLLLHTSGWIRLAAIIFIIGHLNCPKSQLVTVKSAVIFFKDKYLTEIVNILPNFSFIHCRISDVNLLIAPEIFKRKQTFTMYLANTFLYIFHCLLLKRHPHGHDFMGGADGHPHCKQDWSTLLPTHNAIKI